MWMERFEGWVMEFHDICPSKWADFCPYCLMGEEATFGKGLYSTISNPFMHESYV